MLDDVSRWRIDGKFGEALRMNDFIDECRGVLMAQESLFGTHGLVRPD